jgi:uncharacterized protein YciI
MQFLAITRRHTDRFTEAEFAAALEPEAEHARSLYASGAFRQIFSRGDKPGAVMMIEAADLAEAQSIVGSLPFARKKMMDVDIIELRPYRGFAPKG